MTQHTSLGTRVPAPCPAPVSLFLPGSALVLQVYVEASNSATGTGSGSMTSQAILEVEVQDTINSPPSITVNPLLGNDVARVPEDANEGLPLAHVAVTDPDSGKNGIVECSVSPPDFELQPLDTLEYKVGGHSAVALQWWWSLWWKRFDWVEKWMGEFYGGNTCNGKVVE